MNVQGPGRAGKSRWYHDCGPFVSRIVPWRCATATSPIVGGALLQGSLLVLGLPFVVAGALKAAFDLTLWVLFRRADSAGVRERTGIGVYPS